MGERRTPAQTGTQVTLQTGYIYYTLTPERAQNLYRCVKGINMVKNPPINNPANSPPPFAERLFHLNK
jgi:hypothetical protein